MILVFAILLLLNIFQKAIKNYFMRYIVDVEPTN